MRYIATLRQEVYDMYDEMAWKKDNERWRIDNGRISITAFSIKKKYIWCTEWENATLRQEIYHLNNKVTQFMPVSMMVLQEYYCQLVADISVWFSVVIHASMRECVRPCSVGWLVGLSVRNAQCTPGKKCVQFTLQFCNWYPWSCLCSQELYCQSMTYWHSHHHSMRTRLLSTSIPQA